MELSIELRVELRKGGARPRLTHLSNLPPLSGMEKSRVEFAQVEKTGTSTCTQLLFSHLHFFFLVERLLTHLVSFRTEMGEHACLESYNNTQLRAIPMPSDSLALAQEAQKVQEAQKGPTKLLTSFRGRDTLCTHRTKTASTPLTT